MGVLSELLQETKGKEVEVRDGEREPESALGVGGLCVRKSRELGRRGSLLSIPLSGALGRGVQIDRGRLEFEREGFAQEAAVQR